MTAPEVAVITADPQAAIDRLAELRLQGFVVRPGLDLPEQPWSLREARWLASGEIRTPDDVTQAVVAAVRTCGIVVACADERLSDALWADLARLGVGPGPSTAGDPADPLAGLDDDLLDVLDCAAEGLNVPQTAARLFLSVRTTERRLLKARRALAVESTAQALRVYRAGRAREANGGVGGSGGPAPGVRSASSRPGR